MKLECPNCGSNIKYIPGTNNVICTHCNSSSDIEELTNKLVSSGSISKKYSNDFEYCCSSCGAKYIKIDNSEIQICNFCGSQNISKVFIKSNIESKKIIPFQISKEQMIEKFKTHIGNNDFSNYNFFSVNNILKITGIYIPVTIGNYSATFNSSGKLFYHHYGSEYIGNSDYNYTTDYSLSIILDNLKQFPDDIFKNLNPFHFDKAVDFSPYYLADFSIATSDDFYYSRIKASSPTIAMRLYDDAEIIFEAFPNTRVDRFEPETSQLDMTTKSSEKYYVPVWICSYMYNNTLYSFSVNGQTGEVIANLPLDTKKASKAKMTSHKIVIISLLVTFLITMLMAIPLSSNFKFAAEINPVFAIFSPLGILIYSLVMWLIPVMILGLTMSSKMVKGRVDNSINNINPNSYDFFKTRKEDHFVAEYYEKTSFGRTEKHRLSDDMEGWIPPKENKAIQYHLFNHRDYPETINIKIDNENL